jgi:hypothetical protein
LTFEGGIFDCAGYFNRAIVAPDNRPYANINGFRFLRSFNARTAEGVLSNALRLVDVDSRDIVCAKGSLRQYGGSYSAKGLGTVQHILSALLFTVGPDGSGLTNVACETPANSGHSNLVTRGVSLLVYSMATFNFLAIYGTTGGGLQVHNMGHVYVSGGLVGKENTVGLSLLGQSFLTASGGVNQLAITGTLGNISIPNGGYLSNSDLPRKFDSGGGSLLLGTDGVSSVTIPALPSDVLISCSRSILAGTPGTQLTYSVSGNLVTFTSDNTLDRSTIIYHWFSPSTRVGAITA